MKKKPNILICPLDWGLGHATRCVPVIEQLLNRGCKVFIAGSGNSLSFLKNEFPGSEFIHLPSYRFTYSKKGRMALAMLLSFPGIMYGIAREHRQLKKIIRLYGIDGVISDNRFGLWSSIVPCVYMTHQVRIKTSPQLTFIEPLLWKVHRYFIKKYHELWIPDVEVGPSLSGELSHDIGSDINARYIGPLSRFAQKKPAASGFSETEQCDVLAIVSGPEPQRSIFESMIIEQASGISRKIILLQGLPGNRSEPVIKNNLVIYPHLESKRLRVLIENAGIILCRSGYSTIMDLAVLGKKAFFVPTPGQTEQEYLARYLRAQGISDYAPQHKFILADIMKSSANFRGFEAKHYPTDVEQAVGNFVTYI